MTLINHPLWFPLGGPLDSVPHSLLSSKSNFGPFGGHQNSGFHVHHPLLVDMWTLEFGVSCLPTTLEVLPHSKFRVAFGPGGTV